jgi:hypothetical protein
MKKYINGFMFCSVVNMKIAQDTNNLNMLIFWGCVLIALAILKGKEING